MQERITGECAALIAAFDSLRRRKGLAKAPDSGWRGGIQLGQPSKRPSRAGCCDSDKNLALNLLKKYLATFLLLLIGSGAFFSFWLWSYAVGPGPERSGEFRHRTALTPEGTVIIPPRTGFRGIQEILTEAGVIRKDIRFRLLAWYLDNAHRLKAGEYRFAERATPHEVLRQLQAGRIVRWPVTVPEGSNLYDIAEILARGGWVEQESFLSLARDPEFIRELGIAAQSLEGYLFPDTYYLVREQQAGEIIRMMVGRLRQVMARLCDDFAAGEVQAEVQLACTRNFSRPMTLHELLVLASIVEKETGRPEERPLVASVFLNRLEKGMRLQADPTVVYGLLPQFGGRLTRRDLVSDSPYNTYRITGLPPTPIANPGLATLEAVLNPSPSAYLYFVSRNDGSHYFSETLQEHNQAVNRYQRGRPVPASN